MIFLLIALKLFYKYNIGQKLNNNNYNNNTSKKYIHLKIIFTNENYQGNVESLLHGVNFVELNHLTYRRNTNTFLTFKTSK